VDAAKRRLVPRRRRAAGEDPYHHQLCRVNFDGSGFIQLTRATAITRWNFRRTELFIAKYSRADLPTVTELRRSDDGKLICELERADDSRLLKAGWTLPERFAAKAATARRTFMASSSGRQISTRRKNIRWSKKFTPGRRIRSRRKISAAAAAAHDCGAGFHRRAGRRHGTDNRGKKFHDVCWKICRTPVSRPHRVDQGGGGNAAVDGLVARRHYGGSAGARTRCARC